MKTPYSLTDFIAQGVWPFQGGDGASPDDLRPDPAAAPPQDPAQPAEPSEDDLDAAFDARFLDAKPEPDGDAEPAKADEPKPAESDGDPPKPQETAKAEPKPEPAAKAEPKGDPQPEPKPAPAAEPKPGGEPEAKPAEQPKDDEETLRRQALEAQKIADRIVRDYQKRTGKTLTDPAEMQAEAEADAKIRELEHGYPDIHDIVKLMIRKETKGLVSREDFEDFTSNLREQVQAGTMSTATEIELTRVASVHPDWGPVLDAKHPQHQAYGQAVWSWIDELPGKQSREMERALTEGTPEEAISAISAFKEAKGIKDMSELLKGGEEPAANPAAPANPAQPQASADQPPQAAPVETERLEAAQAVPGGGTKAPPSSGGPALPASEKDLDRVFEESFARW